jgi:sulfopyruvate decarboxylase alpha subunit
MNPEEQVIELLKKHRIGYIFSVPCAKIKNLLTLCTQNFTHIPLTREEEGIGLATGIYLAGASRSALLIQSGGIGNSINALISLAVIYKIPIPILISWRGIYKENIIAQNAMGQHITRIFEAIDIPYVEIHDEANISEIDHALKSCFEHETPYGILLSPKIWEKSTLKLPVLKFPSRKRVSEIHITKNIQDPTMTRFEILQGLQTYLKNKIIVSNIGDSSQELYTICDQS